MSMLELQPWPVPFVYAPVLHRLLQSPPAAPDAWQPNQACTPSPLPAAVAAARLCACALVPSSPPSCMRFDASRTRSSHERRTHRHTWAPVAGGWWLVAGANKPRPQSGKPRPSVHARPCSCSSLLVQAPSSTAPPLQDCDLIACGCDRSLSVDGPLLHFLACSNPRCNCHHGTSDLQCHGCRRPFRRLRTGCFAVNRHSRPASRKRSCQEA